MHFALTDDQRLIQETAARFLADRADARARERALTSAEGWDLPLWAAIGDLGWAGLMAPEALGGLGLGAVEMALVLEETGRALIAAPLFETAVLAVQAVLAAGTPAQRAALLPALAAGKCAASLVWAPPGAAPPQLLVAAGMAGRWRLTGEAGFASFGHVAQLLIVAAAGPGPDQISLVLLRPGASGLCIEPRLCLDATRPFARLVFNDVPVGPADQLGAPGAAGPALSRVLDIGAALLAAEQAGAAAHCLSATTEYAKIRVQFGRPVGGFQAVKHALADMMLRVEAARSAAYYAAAIIDAGTGELQEAASIARAYCSDALRHCAGQAIQLHGGIGFTWDHPAHRYFKRARSSATWLGDANWHRARLARLIGLDVPEMEQA